MDVLGELINVCRAADTDKITERKKQVEKLKFLLGKQVIVRALDENANKKTSKTIDKYFSWDTLFKVVKHIILREAESLQKTKDSRSAAAQKKKQDACLLLKMVVKLGNKRGPKLRGSDVVNHVINVMRDDFMRDAFGPDHTAILLKEILGIRKYWCDLSPKSWQELLNLYSSIALVDPPSNFDRVILARLMRTIIQGSAQQCDVRSKKLLPQFEKYFANVRNEHNAAALENVVSATNELCRHIAANSRSRLCAFGEEIAISLLYTWNKRPSDKLKSELVEFFQLQMCIHHPRGARCLTEGATAANWDQWKKSLHKLYHAIYTDLDDLYSRTRFALSKETGSSGLGQQYICLATDVCHQLFGEQTSVLDITITQSMMEPESGNAAKRRRIDTGWGVVRDSLTKHGPHVAAVPWLQVLECLLHRYPRSLPEEEFLPFLSCLQQMYTDSCKSEVTRHLAECLGAVAGAQKAMDTTDNMQTTGTALWNKVWTNSVRMISLHHAADEAYRLLQILLEMELVNPDPDFWSLFSRTISPRSQPAVQFLACLLSHAHLPERLQPKSVSISMEAGHQSNQYPLRMQLLDWLLPSRDVELEEGRGEPAGETGVRDVDTILLANVLVTLTLRDTLDSTHTSLSVTVKESSGSLNDNPETSGYTDGFLCGLQELYLQSTFDTGCSQDSESAISAGVSSRGSSILGSVQDRLMELLTRDTRTLLSNSQPSEVSSTEVMAVFCSLLVHVLHSMVGHGNVKIDEVLTCPLHESLKLLLRRLAVGVTDLFKRDAFPNPRLVLVHLRHLFALPPGELQGSHNQQVATLVRTLTPNKLVDQLMDIAYGKIRLGKKSSSGASSTSCRQILRPAAATPFDDFDMDTTNGGGDQEISRMDDSDDEFEVTQTQSQMGDSSKTNQPVGCESLLNPSILTDTEQLRLLVVDLLCVYCSHEDIGRNNNEINSNKEQSVFASPSKTMESVGRRLIGVLTNDSGWSPTRPFDLQLVCHLVNGLAGGKHVSDYILEEFMTALSGVCREQRRDQAVCTRILQLLNTLAPHFAPESGVAGSEVREEARDGAVQLLKVFWRLSQEGQYSSSTRRALCHCLLTFIKMDPLGEWTRWPQSANDGAGNNGEVLMREKFQTLLEDRCHSIRMIAAMNVTCLFRSAHEDSCVQYGCHFEDSLFDLVYSSCQTALGTQGRLSPEEMRDEAANRASSSLTTLAAVARSSVTCEKKAILAICQLMHDHNLDLVPVQKALQGVWGCLGYSSAKEYLQQHLGYLAQHWVSCEYPLTAFPHRLLDYSDQNDCFRANLSAFVPVLVMAKDMVALETLCGALEVERGALLEECLPQTLVHILPLFAVSKCPEVNDNVKHLQKKVNFASACYDQLTEILTQQRIEDLIQSHLEEIVVDVIMTLHDPSTDANSGSCPEPNPPAFSERIVKCTLDYLTRGHSAASLVSLLAKSQDGLQCILLSLSSQLHAARRPHARLRSLRRYGLLVSLVLAEFDGQLGGAWAYILRDVIYTLVHTVQATDKNKLHHCGPSQQLVATCVQLLGEVCDTAVLSCPLELGRFLSVIVCTLVPLVDNSTLTQQVQSLLNRLLVDGSGRLEGALGLLHPLPDTLTLASARKSCARDKYQGQTFTLRQEIEHFVKCSYHDNSFDVSHLGKLQLLHRHLVDKKCELPELVAECEGQTHSAVLLQLICDLLHLTQTSNQEVAAAAGQCLGELGPVDLGVCALPEKRRDEALLTALDAYESEPDLQKYCSLFHSLNHCLIHSNLEVVRAAGNVLKKALATRTGQAFYADYKSRVPDSLFQYLHPFKSPRKKVTAVADVDRNETRFISSVGGAPIWCSPNTTHVRWLTRLTLALIDSGAVYDEVLQLLSPICEVKPDVCELVLPFLIHDVLVHGTETHRRVLSQHVNAFFQHHCDNNRTQAAPQTQGVQCVCSGVPSVRTMLAMVQYLRLKSRPGHGKKGSTAWDNNFWLTLDYHQVALAAQHCSMYFTALLYTEIWCYQKRDLQEAGDSETQGASTAESQSSGGSQGSVLATVSQIPRPAANNCDPTFKNSTPQELMAAAYSAIGDPDGAYGCGAGHSADPLTRVKTYEHESEWSKALGSYDLQMSLGDAAPSTQHGLLQALQQFGCSHVLEGYLSQLTVGGRSRADIQQLQYEVAAQSANWSLSVPARLNSESGYQCSLYAGLTALRDHDLNTAQHALKIARTCAMRSLVGTTMQSVQNVYPVLSWLQCAGQTEHVVQALQGLLSVPDLLTRWQHQDVLLTGTPRFVEPTIRGRCVLLQLWQQKGTAQTVELRDVQKRTLQQLAAFCTSNQRHLEAEKAIYQLRKLSSHDPTGSGCVTAAARWQVEEAQMFWARGEHTTAQVLMRGLIRRLEQVQDVDEEAVFMFPRCLGIYGNWLAETKSESPSVIMEQYLSKAVDLLEMCACEDDTAIDAFLSLARFADAQYQSIINHMKSSTFEAKQALISRAKDEADKLRKLGETNGEASDAESRYLKTLEKQRIIDEQELKQLASDRQRYLVNAVESYIKCLRLGGQHDLRVFRLTSLWFDNCGQSEITRIIKAALPKLAPHKFLPLMYQLAARMGNSGTAFHTTLNQLIERAALHHPHHTLPVILALAHATKDDEVLPDRGRRSRLSRGTESQDSTESQEERVVAAQAVLERLRATKCGATLKNWEKLSLAYIQLANWNVDKYKKETRALDLPASLWLTKIKQLMNVAMPTLETKVDPTGEYSDLVTIAEFKTTFKLAGGINLPKIISCIGSDGVSRRQLVKGKDDLRQDAVMQQVFCMVNNLLHKDPHTRQRHLHVCTYKVVPLSQRSGVLEWCEGTMPLGEYLTAGGNGGAHYEYRPQDWKAIDCRKVLNNAHQSGSLQDKMQAYQRVCRHFKPVFRHFFTENFPDPMHWYERRLTYTRSVATNSIVGYILGLGDRHVQNILINQRSGALVHIDLGVAFEQGQILPTPETVPFRLTRDIVDGMGVAGTEGIFRRCCEKTMEVMHTHQESLLTILCVLLYDPLYVWSVSPQKAYALQQMRADMDVTDGDIVDMDVRQNISEPTETVNKVAERVLLRLQQKLGGVEEGVQLSLRGQVNLLIQAGVDPNNLCRLFPGWQPYL